MHPALCRRPPEWRYFVKAVAVASCLLLAGCMPIPILLPNLSQSDAVRTAATGLSPSESCEVRAFRVDVTEHYLGIGGGNKSETRCTIREIPPTPSGEIPAQTAFSFDRGVFLWTLGDGLLGVTFDDLAVRLYRPGYTTMRVAPRRDATALEWWPAPTWREQEGAVDSLLRLPSGGAWRDYGQWSPGPPIWGCTTEAHRHALLFAASEYERIAAALPPDAAPEDRARLHEKSSTLRQAASGSGSSVEALQGNAGRVRQPGVSGTPAQRPQ